MSHSPVIFADGNWIGIVITLVVILVSVANQFLGGEKGKAAGRPQPPARRPPKARPVPQRQAVDDEVEEFVRRASERRGREPQRREVELIRPEPPKPPIKRSERRIQPASQLSEKPAPQQPRQVKRLEPKIETHVDTSDITGRAGQLSELERDAAQLQEHVHQVFDHQLGRLETTPATAAQKQPATTGQNAGQIVLQPAPVRAAAAGLAVALADPENLRQAIVLNEVLRRPLERW